MTPEPATSLPERLRAALVPAMRRRDQPAVAALRSTLAAIGNAEAVTPAEAVNGAGPDTRSRHIAGAAVGLGAAEAERRQLTEADVERVVGAEVADRRAAADGYARSGQTGRADRLLAEAAALESVTGRLPTGAPPVP